MTLIVHDPARRGLVLASHAGLVETDARELVAAYSAMGYPPSSLVLSPNDEQSEDGSG